MQQIPTGEAILLQQILTQNTNTKGCKQVVGEVAKAIEQRTFWYFTSDEAGFLNKVYDKKLDRQVLKNRIQQITAEQMDDVMSEIITGKLKKDNQIEQKLQVQLGIQNFYQEIPGQDDRSKRSREKIKEINEDLKRFRQSMEEKKRFLESRKHEKEALQQQFRKSLQKEKLEQRRSEIRQHLDSLKKKQVQRKQSEQKFKAFLKQYKKAKPLHVMMQEIYKEKVVLPALEQSRKKLESLTHKKKPTLDEINDHERLYLQTKSNRPQKVILLNNTIDVSYKSHFYKSEEEKERERREFEQIGPSWDFLQKQKRYSQFVKDKVRPKISKKLKESLEETIKQSHVCLQSPDRSKVIQVGKNYLQYMRNLQKRRTSTPSQPVETVKESRYLNYLQELKSKSEHHSSKMDWQRDMRDRTASKLEKRQKVLMKSKQLELKAMMDEKVVSHYSYNRADEIIAKKKQIDQTLLSSIKAKVAVLKDAHSP